MGTEQEARGVVHPEIYDLATVQLMAHMTPEVDDYPCTPAQWLWLLNELASLTAKTLMLSPNIFDLDIAVHVTANLQAYHGAQVWTTYPPSYALRALVPIVHRLRVLLDEFGELAHVTALIDARYQQSLKNGGGDLSPEDAFDWLIVGALQELG